MELEKREQGFALYLNGANTSSFSRKHDTLVHHTPHRDDPSDVSQPISFSTFEPGQRTRPSRTAGNDFFPPQPRLPYSHFTLLPYFTHLLLGPSLLPLFLLPLLCTLSPPYFVTLLFLTLSPPSPPHTCFSSPIILHVTFQLYNVPCTALEEGFTFYRNHIVQVGSTPPPPPPPPPPSHKKSNIFAHLEQSASVFLWCSLFVSFSDPALAGGEGNTALSEEEVRAKTAPSKRKSWSHKAVDLRVAEGASIHVEAPGQLCNFKFCEVGHFCLCEMFLHPPVSPTEIYVTYVDTC